MTAQSGPSHASQSQETRDFHHTSAKKTQNSANYGGHLGRAPAFDNQYSANQTERKADQSGMFCELRHLRQVLANEAIRANILNTCSRC